MKKLILPAIAICAIVFSCSKKPETILPSLTNGTVTIGGTTYTTVVIGSQIWTTGNYNGDGGVNYNLSATNTAANGKLYTTAEAGAITLPTGWALPTQDDYNTLLAAIGGVKASDGSYSIVPAQGNTLIDTTGWKVKVGTNSSGFSGTAAGYFHSATFTGSGAEALFTTKTSTAQGTTCFHVYQDSTGTKVQLMPFITDPADRASIRFVKD